MKLTLDFGNARTYDKGKENIVFEVHIHISPDSPRGRIVQRYADQEHITPEQAVERLLDEAVKSHTQPTPAQQLIGAFSSPQDRLLIDEAMEVAKRLREIDAKRHFDN